MTVGAEPKPLSAFWRTVKKIDKSKINNRWMALRNALAVAVPLAIGIAVGNPLGAVAVTTGALNVSFSDGRDPYFQRARRMIAWSILGALAVFVGSITGNYGWAAILIVACWAFLAGLLISLGQSAGDLGLNTLVALIVFAGRGATTPRGALNTGLLVLAGGLLQSGFCLAFWPLRRGDPERRAVGRVYLELANEVDPDSESDPAPLKPRSAEEQDTIDALGNQHTVEGERFRLLFDQADRLRLSIYRLARLRDQLGERDNQKSEAEGDAADVLDAVLRSAAKLLEALGTQLIGRLATADIVSLRSDLDRLAETANQQKGLPLAASIASAVDVLAGQLRLVSDLVDRAEVLEMRKPASRAVPDFKTQFSNWVSTLRANLDWRSTVCRHAIRMSLCVAAGDWLERSLGWQRAYWLPMTVAVVLKPDFTSTFSRGVLRLLGTFAGLILATALFRVLPVSAVTQLLLVGGFTFCLRYWGPANYGVFTISISGLVVFLIAATGSSPGDAMAARAANTVAGGVLAAIAYAVWPTWERTQFADSFAEMIDASRVYLQSVIARFAKESRTEEAHLGHERLEWRRARTNVESSVDRIIAEPGITAAKRDTLLSMLASSHALMLAIVGLEAGLGHGQPSAPPEALQKFAHDVDFTLYYLAAALRGSKPASESLPQLREDYRKLIEARDRFSQDDGYFLAETDRLIVSLNTLREQVMRYANSP
jgi:uncharacterized membrane protein YccC